MNILKSFIIAKMYLIRTFNSLSSSVYIIINLFLFYKIILKF